MTDVYEMYTWKPNINFVDGTWIIINEGIKRGPQFSVEIYLTYFNLILRTTTLQNLSLITNLTKHQTTL